MKFKWINCSEGASVQVGDYIGAVEYVGKDLFGNTMYDTFAYNKATRNRLKTSEYGLPYTYKEDAIKAVERAIKKELQGL